MFDQVITVFSFVAIAVGLLASFAGGIGFFKAKRGDSIIKYQDKEIEIKNTKILEQEKDLIAAAAREKALTESKEKLEGDIEFLKSLKQGSPQLKLLTEAVNNNTTLINKWLEKETSK